MDDLLLENLSPATIIQIACDIRDGTASPEDAKRLMLLFCSCVDGDNQPPMELLRHFRDAFNAILRDEKNPKRALGLTRKRARPHADPDTRIAMAHKLLMLRLRDKSHQDSLYDTSAEFDCGETIIGKAWNDHKQDAYNSERLIRVLDENPWTDDEVSRLIKIFGKEPWFVAPVKSVIKAA